MNVHVGELKENESREVNQADIKSVLDNFGAFERLFSQYLEERSAAEKERAYTEKPLPAGDGLELNAAPIIASFTDDQWRELEVANMHFYEKLSSLGDVVSLAHLAITR